MIIRDFDRITRWVVLLAMGFTASASAQYGADEGQWKAYSGDKGSTKYSGLDQINKDNVAQLNVAWRWRFPDNDTDKKAPPQMKVTPLVVGRRYVCQFDVSNRVGHQRENG